MVSKKKIEKEMDKWDLDDVEDDYTVVKKHDKQ